MYTKKVQIEARVLGDLVMNHIVPVAIEYQTKLIDNAIRPKHSSRKKKLRSCRLKI